MVLKLKPAAGTGTVHGSEIQRAGQELSMVLKYSS